MNAFARVRSISGTPLTGSKVVRVIYLDESGTSPRQKVLTVAGIIVHGDTQIVPIEDHLEALVEKHIPENNRDGFFFHATDIYHGGSKDCIFHDKDAWPAERRWAILDDLATVPSKFGVPVCVFVLPKAEIIDADHIRDLNPSKQEIAVAQHTMAIIQCEAVVETWMRNNAKDEVALVTAEDNSDVRAAAKAAHLTVRNKSLMQKFGLEGHPFFPFRHIKDGLQFADKAECKLLQVADFCSWAIRRAGEGADDAGRWYRPIRPQVIAADAELARAFE